MLKLKSVLYLFMTVLVVTLSDCTSDVYNPDVCFQENILPIFVSNCATTGCHNSIDKAEEYDLTSYEGIMKGVVANHPSRSEVYKVISGNNPSMPTENYPKLSNKDVSYIKLWIDMGAKNTSNCSSCDTMSFTYSARIKPLITTWCVGCHSSGSSGGGFNLSNYSGVSAVVATGQFLGSIQHASGFSAMPKNASKLSDCDIKVIEKWIAAGYIDN